MRKIVVIGTGLAGYTFAKELRKIDSSSSLLMLSSDDGAFYSKPLLSNAIAKNKQADQIATATHEDMAQQLSAQIINRVSVSSINVEQKTVSYRSHSTASETITFDELVLCLGAAQRQSGLTTESDDLLHSVNDLNDYRRLRECLSAVQNVSIVGTGLIGCEFANDLLAANKKVTVIGPGASPLANLVPPQVGNHIESRLHKAGVNWRLGVKAVGLQQADQGAKLLLSDGTQLDTDLVITAIGLVSRIQLAKESGIEVNNGIVVNDRLQTNRANVYALGDCAEINGSVMPFVLPIMHCARVLAANISGEPSTLKLPYMPVIVKTPACSTVVLPVAKGINGQWQISAQGDDIKGIFNDESGQLRGFVLTGSTVSERQSLMKQLPPI